MAKNKVQFTLRLDGEVDELLQYWSKKQNISKTEFISDAIMFYIGHYNKDYDLPTAEIQRLNQLVDVITSLTYSVDDLQTIVTTGLGSLLKMAKGDSNYLIDDYDIEGGE